VLGGWGLYVAGATLRYVHNLAGAKLDRITSAVRIEPGHHRLGFAFERTGDFTGTGRLYVDELEVAAQPIELFTPARFSITGAGLTCGYELGPAVDPELTAPNRFAGTIHRAVVDVTGAAYRDVVAELAAILSEQ
jgi:arylsulfatase